MVKGKTSSGFEYSIDEAILNDWRLTSALARLARLGEDLEDEEALEFITIMVEIEQVLFKDKGRAFEKHIAKKHNKTVPVEIALAEIMEILNSSKETKNS